VDIVLYVSHLRLATAVQLLSLCPWQSWWICDCVKWLKELGSFTCICNFWEQKMYAFQETFKIAAVRNIEQCCCKRTQHTCLWAAYWRYSNMTFDTFPSPFPISYDEAYSRSNFFQFLARPHLSCTNIMQMHSCNMP